MMLSDIYERWRLRADLEISQYQKGLLQAELTVLQPTLILFVTGPNYDEYLHSEFDELMFEQMDAFELRQLSKLTCPALTAPAYRTYHPGYLNRNRTLGFAPIAAAISDAIGPW